MRPPAVHTPSGLPVDATRHRAYFGTSAGFDFTLLVDTVIRGHGHFHDLDEARRHARVARIAVVHDCRIGTVECLEIFAWLPLLTRTRMSS